MFSYDLLHSLHANACTDIASISDWPLTISCVLGLVIIQNPNSSMDYGS